MPLTRRTCHTLSSDLTPQGQGWGGGCYGCALGKNKGRRRGERDVGSPVAKVRSSELEICHLLGLAQNFPPRQQGLPPHYLLSLSSVTLYLLLIGFNERFNKTALPDQIKLLLATMLNPGSLLCNATAAQCSPSCQALPDLFSAPALTPTSPIILSGPFNVSPVQPRTGWDQTSSHKSGGVAFDLTTFQFRAKISTWGRFSCRLSGLKWDYPLRGKTSKFKKGTGNHACIASKRHDDLCIVSVLREICRHRSTKLLLNL